MSGAKEAGERADDYSRRHQTVLNKMFALKAELVMFYEHVYRPQKAAQGQGDLPTDLWRLPNSRAVADAITAYLFMRFKTTQGRHQNGYVLRDTLKSWADMTIVLAMAAILGKDGEDIPDSVFKGTLGDKTDSLPHLITHWAGSMCDQYKLAYKIEKGEFWGLREAGITIDRLHESLLSTTLWNDADADVTAITIVQLALVTSSRTGAYARTDGRENPSVLTIPESNVRIRQNSPGSYDLCFEFTRMKGFNAAEGPEANFPVELPPVTRLRNLKFELATTVIPSLLARSRVCSKDSMGNVVVYEDIEEFLMSPAYEFYVESDSPLLRSFNNQRQWVDMEMSTQTAAVMLRTASYDAGLPNGRPFAYRHGGGAVARISGGKELQAVYLNHGYLEDVGRRIYSKAITDAVSTMQRHLFGEWRDTEADAENRMNNSDHVKRCNRGRAVQTTHRKLFGRGASLDEPDFEVINKMLQASPEYQQVATELIREMRKEGDDRNVERINALKLQVKSHRQTCRRNAHTDVRRKFNESFDRIECADASELDTTVQYLDLADKLRPVLIRTDEEHKLLEDFVKANVRRESGETLFTVMDFEEDHPDGAVDAELERAGGHGDELDVDFLLERAALASPNRNKPGSARVASEKRYDIRTPAASGSTNARAASAALKLKEAAKKVQETENGVSGGNVDKGKGKERSRPETDDHELDEDVADKPTFHIFVDVDPKLVTPEETSALLQARADLMRAYFHLLTAAQPLDTAYAQAQALGRCQYCPLGVVGTIPRRTGQNNSIFWSKSARGLCIEKRSVFVLHLRRYHPDILDKIMSGTVPRGINFVHKLSTEEITRAAHFMAGATVLADECDYSSLKVSDEEIKEVLEETHDWLEKKTAHSARDSGDEDDAMDED